MKYNGIDTNKIMRNGERVRGRINGKDLETGIITDGLVLWLDGEDFSNSPPTATWVDKSGNGNDGTINGFAYTSTSGSDGNGGVKLDGVDDHIKIDIPSVYFVQILFKHNKDGILPREYLFSGGDTTNTYIYSNSSSIGEIKYKNEVIVTTLELSILQQYEKCLFSFSTNGEMDGTSVVGAIKTRTSGFSDATIYKVLMYNRIPTESEILQNSNALIGG